jgi:hypothetical protein
VSLGVRREHFEPGQAVFREGGFVETLIASRDR